MSPSIHQLVARQADQRPQGLAVIDWDGRRVDYATHQAAVLEAAALLQGKGVRPGDRVMIVAENCHATAALIFAASTLGAIAVPVNARMTAPELDRIIRHATPRVIAYTQAVSAEAAAHALSAQARPFQTSFGVVSLLGLDPPPDANTAQAAVILYTTGTTGAPKGVMLTHANLGFAGALSANIRGMLPSDIVYGALPLTHVFGLASMLMAATQEGAAVQLETRFGADRLFNALLEEVTIFPGVPQMHAMLMHYATAQGVTQLRGTGLRYVSSGAAPLDPVWKRKAEAIYGVPLQNGYGLTESTAGICATRNPIGSADTSVGPPLPGVQIRLDRAAGPASEADVGEILTKGPHIMAGYYRNKAETAKVIDPEGWLRTGDLGRIDAQGNLHVVGRAKELIIRGGFNIYPPEVEAALNAHPQVIQSVVIGRAHQGDEQILAFVQCADPAALTIDDLRAFAATRLTAYKRPSQIILATDLPAAPTGKILKHRLLEVFATHLDELE